MSKLAERGAIYNAITEYYAGTTSASNRLAGAGQLQALVYEYLAAGITEPSNRLTPKGRVQGFIWDDNTARALAILASYGTDAHVYLPGIGTINGLTAGNYLESTGNTISTVDGLVGLALDAGGSVGSELIINGTNLVNTTGWSVQTGGTISAVSGSLEISGAGFNAYQSFTTVIGKKYAFKYTPVLNGNQCVVSVGSSIGAGENYSVGSATNPQFIQFVATATTTFVSIKTLGSAARYNFISVFESSGIHAKQTTTANKPFLRKGAVNILLNSATLSTQSVTTVATPYTLSFKGTGSVQLSGTSTVLLSGTGATTRVSTTFTPTAGTLTLTVTGTVTEGMLNLGSLADYVATTSAAKSNQVGNYAWENNSTDSFALDSVPFQMADDHCVIAAIRPDSVAAGSKVIHSIYGAGTQKIAQLSIETATLTATWTDDAGTSGTSPTGVVVTAGTPLVACARKTGNTKELFRNDVLVNASTTAAGATTVTTAAIGGIAATNNFIGLEYVIIGIKGTVSDTNKTILSRFAGSLAGVTI